MTKGRIFSGIGYLESMKENWLELLEETGLAIAVSPYHDKDVEATGEIKKAHYHILFKFEGPTTLKHISDICKGIGIIQVKKIESLRGMYRYHLHLDSPDKYQYEDKDRVLLNGFDPKDADALTATEIDRLTTEILAFIDDNEILEYSDLLYEFRTNHCTNMLTVAKQHTMLLNSYIKSKRHKLEKNKKLT